MPSLSNGIFAALVLTIVLIMPQQAPFAQTSVATDGVQSFNTLLAAADTAAGEQVSHRCTVCHTFDKGGPDKLGPNLWNIVGDVRARSGSFHYSDELKSMRNEKWTYDALNLWLKNPHKFAPGDKMPFAGLADRTERANLIAWMRTLSDNPAPLPPVK